MKRILFIFLMIVTATTAKAQSPTRGGGNNQLQSWYGGFKVIRLFNPPFTFNPWATDDSLGMVWIDSTTTKKLMWHTGVYRRYVASERYVDSLFATAVTGVTQQTLDDSCAAIRADISGGSTDSAVYSTKAYRQKGIDSVNGTVATRVKYTDTASMLLPYQRTVNATSGTVTSVATGYGVSGGTITTSGTISADTAAMATRSRVQKAVDSLNVSIGTKGSGTVTSVATNNGSGITGGTITGTGTIAADTFLLGTRAWRNKAADSVAALIPSVTGYVPYTGATTNVNLGAHNLTATRGNFDTLEPNTSAGLHIHNTSHQDIMIAGAGGGQTLTIYAATNLDQYKIQNSVDTVLTTNSSGTIGKTAIATYYVKKADSFDYSTRAWRQKAVDSLNTVIATKGSGTVTSIATGYGLSGGTITTTGTLIADTGVNSLSTKAYRQKGVDSLNIQDGLRVKYTDTAGMLAPYLRTVNAVTATSTTTLTNKRWTARVTTQTTVSATPSINTDNQDIWKVTAQTADITSMTTNLSGTPADGDILEIQITGTAARAITWGSSFVSSTVTLPTTTTTTATLTVILQYYTTSSYGNNKWVCVNYF
jgi:hypothetical protein